MHRSDIHGGSIPPISTKKQSRPKAVLLFDTSPPSLYPSLKEGIFFTMNPPAPNRTNKYFVLAVFFALLAFLPSHFTQVTSNSYVNTTLTFLVGWAPLIAFICAVVALRTTREGTISKRVSRLLVWLLGIFALLCVLGLFLFLTMNMSSGGL
jgi:hypothetical protein